MLGAPKVLKNNYLIYKKKVSKTVSILIYAIYLNTTIIIWNIVHSIK